MTEHQIAVLFDVTAANREIAARTVALALGASALLKEQPIESWWLPEPDVQHVDGNDNLAQVLVMHRLVRTLLEYLRWQANHGDAITSCNIGEDKCPHCAAAYLAANISKLVPLVAA